MKKTYIAYATVIIQFGCLGIIFFAGPLLAANHFLLLVQIAGILLGLWAIGVQRIGNFNITPQLRMNGRLILHGPYRWIRHPMYSAVFLCTTPVVIETTDFLHLSSFALLTIDLIFKLAYEENLLLQKYPEYEEYCAGTKRLMPFVY